MTITRSALDATAGIRCSKLFGNACITAELAGGLTHFEWRIRHRAMYHFVLKCAATSVFDEAAADDSKRGFVGRSFSINSGTCTLIAGCGTRGATGTITLSFNEIKSFVGGSCAVVRLVLITSEG